MESELPLLVTMPPARRIAWIETDGRAFYRGCRVPRKVAFFVAGWHIAKSARWMGE